MTQSRIFCFNFGSDLLPPGTLKLQAQSPHTLSGLPVLLKGVSPSPTQVTFHHLSVLVRNSFLSLPGPPDPLHVPAQAAPETTSIPIHTAYYCIVPSLCLYLPSLSSTTYS